MSLFHTSQTEGEELSLTDLKTNLTLLIVDSLFFNREEMLTENVPLLVGKQIEHSFLEDSDIVKLPGYVISVVLGFSSWYNVKYDDDETISTYQLQNDNWEGNLRIIVQSSRYNLCWLKHLSFSSVFNLKWNRYIATTVQLSFSCMKKQK